MEEGSSLPTQRSPTAAQGCGFSGVRPYSQPQVRWDSHPMFQQVNRREFLGIAATAGTLLGGISQAFPADTVQEEPKPPPLEDRRLILVLFGGGTRSSESIADPEHRYIPPLWKEMVPRGTLWTNMRVEHRVVHPNCNASIKTGHWEYDDLDWSNRRSIRPSSKSPANGASCPTRRPGPSPMPRFWPTPAAARRGLRQPVCRQRGRATDDTRDHGRGDGTPDGCHPLLWLTGSRKEGCRQVARLARSESRIATAGLRSAAARRWLDRQYQAWRQAAGTTSHDAFLADRAVGA